MNGSEQRLNLDPRPAPAASRVGSDVGVEIVEYTDPFCSWAWSTEPKLRRLRLALGGRAHWRVVLGVLLDGTEEGGALDDRIADQYRRWDDVVAHTRTPLPARLDRPAASSRLAALAAKAALLQGEPVAERVVRRLRESLFVAGRPADDEAGLLDAIAGTAGLDVGALLSDLHGSAARDAAAADWEETRRPLPDVIGLTEPPPHPGGAAPDGDRLRYRFPTLVVTGPAGRAVVPGWRPLEDYLDAVAAVAPEVDLHADAVLSPREALERFETLTEVDVELLIGSGEPPADAIAIEMRHGVVWAEPRRALALADGVVRDEPVQLVSSERSGRV